LTLSQSISQWWLIQQLKKPWFWVSMILGAALSFMIYQEVMVNLWAFESLRVKVYSIILFVFLSAACFCILNFFLLPHLKQLSTPQRVGIFILSAFIPFILVFAITNLQEFSKATVYPLLPSHTLSIEALAADIGGNEDIVLSEFSNQAQGVMSFNALHLKGWERRGNQLFLIDPADNQITWKGKVGYDATIVFMSRSIPAKIDVSWDGMNASYSLFSASAQNISIQSQFGVPFYAGWLLIAIAFFLSTAFLASVLFIGLLSFPGFSASPPHTRWAWVIYAAPMYITWSVYLLVFWPGFVSADTINQWEQMLTGELVNWHPVAHTLTIWLVTRLWYTPAAMAIFQILVLGGVLGWGIATLREIGMPAWLGWLVAVFLAILPSNGVLSITLWKDILFSAVVVALTILALKIVVTRGAWLKRKASWFFLGIVLTLVSLYRQNGFFVALGCLVILTLAFRKYWKSFARAIGLFLVVYFVFTGPVFRMLNVKSENRARYQVVIANLLAGQMNAGTYFSPQDRAVLKPAFTEDPWPYNCYRNPALIITGNLDRDYLEAHTRDLINIALKVTLENPLVTLGHFACQGAFVYRIPQDSKYYETVIMTVFENNFGLRQSSIIPDWYSRLFRTIQRQVPDPDINWLIWRMPFWMYLCVSGCAFYVIKNKNWQPLLVLTPGLLTVLPYIALSLGQIFRYVYSMYLIGILLSGYFWLCTLPKEYVHE